MGLAFFRVEVPNENREALFCVPIGALVDHHGERACPTSLNHWRGPLLGQATLHDHSRLRPSASEVLGYPTVGQ